MKAQIEPLLHSSRREVALQARRKLDDVVQRGNAMAARGELSGEQAAHLARAIADHGALIQRLEGGDPVNAATLAAKKRRLAEIIEEANALAASGQIDGAQAAQLDNAIARYAQRLHQMEAGL
jgi:hypothetical protein